MPLIHSRAASAFFFAPSRPSASYGRLVGVARFLLIAVMRLVIEDDDTFSRKQFRADPAQPVRRIGVQPVDRRTDEQNVGSLAGPLPRRKPEDMESRAVARSSIARAPAPGGRRASVSLAADRRRPSWPRAERRRLRDYLRRYLKETAASPDEIERMPFADLIQIGNVRGLLPSVWSAWRRFREMRVRASNA